MSAEESWLGLAKEGLVAVLINRQAEDENSATRIASQLLAIHPSLRSYVKQWVDTGVMPEFSGDDKSLAATLVNNLPTLLPSGIFLNMDAIRKNPGKDHPLLHGPVGYFVYGPSDDL
jgi:hypothetical protein